MRLMAKQQKYNGIHLQNSIRITSETSLYSNALVCIAQWFVILCGIVSLIFGLVSGLQLTPDYKLLIWSIIITTVIYIAIHEIKIASVYISISYMILVAYAIYRFFSFIANGFYCLENAIMDKAAPYYGIKRLQFIVEKDPKLSITILLIVFSQFAAFVTAMEVYRHYLKLVYLLLAVLCNGILLAVGQTPNAFWLLVTIGVMIAMRAMDNVPNAVKKEMPKKGTANIQGSKRQRIRVKTAYLCILALLVLVLLARLVVSNTSYEKFDVPAKKQNLQEAIKDFSWEDTIEKLANQFKDWKLFSSSKTTGGGLDSGKLGRTGEVKFTNESALLVTMDEDTNFLYLKGFAGVNYTGDEWTNLTGDDQDRFDEIQERYSMDSCLPETLLRKYINEYMSLPVEFDGGVGHRYLNLNEGKVSVDYVNANKKFMYAPYLTQYSNSEKLHLVGDQYLKPDSENGFYEFKSVYQPAGNLMGINQLITDIYSSAILSGYELSNPNYTSYEKAYREFVYDVYTRLPKEGLDRLRAIRLDVRGTGAEWQVSLITEVINYLRANTTYSLSPGRPDKNTDFAEYFLFDAKKGYCSHYATAATLILRKYGVPARYVEGYVVPHSEIITGSGAGVSIVNVTDMNAHAWVEVYFDGVGWIPIEVTNGYSDDGPQQILPQISNAAGTPVPTPTVTAAPTKEPTVTPTPQATPTLTPAPDQESGPKTTPKATQTVSPVPGTESGTATGGNILAKAVKTFFAIITAAGLLFAVFYIRYLLVKKVSDHGLHSKHTQVRVLSYYRKIYRILGDAHIRKDELESYEEFANKASKNLTALPDGFDTIVDLALKARFGKEAVSPKEVKYIRDYYADFRTRYLMKQKQIIRILMKYWKVL